jgi:hypothetical protein
VKFEYLFFAFFAFVVGNLIWRYFRSGSLTGALLGGRIKREIGQILLVDGTVSSRKLTINAMESSDGESFVGLALVSKAPLGASMVPFKLTKVQAQDLVRLLQQAIA